MRNTIISVNEEGMCVNLSALADALQKNMKMFEQSVEEAPREVIPEFSENFGWFLHTHSVGTIPLTKYCTLQEMYVKVHNKMYTSFEVPLYDIMSDFTTEQLEVLLPIIFNA